MSSQIEADPLLGFCQSCGTPQHQLNIHYGKTGWHICEVCGLAERVFAPTSANDQTPQLATRAEYLPKRYSNKRLEQFASVDAVVLDEANGTVAGAPTTILVREGFWLRSDAILRLKAMVQGTAEDTKVMFLVPLSRGRAVNLGDISTLVGDGSFAFRFGWQTFFMILVRLGFKEIWRYDAEGGSAGLHLVTATVGSIRQRRKLSVVMPVFNEKSTIAETFARVDAKLRSIEAIDSEIVLVESNSSDGTKEVVQSLPASERLKVVWQKQPRGKGHAVREGLNHVTGDMVLIQDADNEYSVEDYDHLIDALVTSRSPFVLGSRDTSAWKMRAFEGASTLSFLYNFGHVFFTSYLNALLGTRLHDPFTMYKVFFRECIHGLEFNCNRFDFDHELVIKLVRKGFLPIELPASYAARSHAEGKKVSVFKDGIFWLTTDIRLRFEALSAAKYR